MKFTTQSMLLFVGIFSLLAIDQETWIRNAENAYQRAIDSCDGCRLVSGLKHVTIIKKNENESRTRKVFEKNELDKAKDFLRQYNELNCGIFITFVPERGEMGYGSFDDCGKGKGLKNEQ